MIAFGPVPSRRLGRSLGINNIPPKICTYSCAYCQLGRTLQMQAARQTFYKPMDILNEVRDKVEQARDSGERIDYLTLVPDGEPTLDVELGREIRLLKSLGIPVAAITNASLLGQPEVRQDLMAADWVSLKMDAIDEQTWRRIDRPHRGLELPTILDGARAFARDFAGTLATETMLVAGVNDREADIELLAGFLARLQPTTAYLSVPTRPPAEEWVQPPDENALNRAYQILSQQVSRVEYLVGYEGDAFALTGDVEEDLLSITAVHPMREDAVTAFLARAAVGWETVHALVAKGQMIRVEYKGHTFYMHKLGRLL